MGNIDSPISNVHYDSRRFVQDNEHVFLAFKTNFNDGHKYINQVYENGIRQFITHETPLKIKKDAGYLVVENTLLALQKNGQISTEKILKFQYFQLLEVMVKQL